MFGRQDKKDDEQLPKATDNAAADAGQTTVVHPDPTADENSDNTDWQHPGTPLDDTTPTDNQAAPATDQPTETPSAPAQPEPEAVEAPSVPATSAPEVEAVPATSDDSPTTPASAEDTQPAETQPSEEFSAGETEEPAKEEPAAPTPTPIVDVSGPAGDFNPPADPSAASEELIDIKKKALADLSPLVDHLDQSPEEKFRTMMMMIQASDDQTMVKAAFDAAEKIEDEKARAQALLDIVNEINYFTQPHNQ